MEQTKTIFLLSLFSVFITVCGQEKQIIVIDPGHGGTDRGAVGINGLREKDLTLKIAQAIVHYHKIVLDDRYDIYLTRYGDTLISLGHRTKLAKILNPKIFVSLHCNHANNTKAMGLEIYVFNGSIPEQSLSMAKTMDEYLQEHLGYRSRGVKRANFQVLRDNRGVCPTLLLELGFLSNSDEATHLEEDGKIKALGLAIVMGIHNILK